MACLKRRTSFEREALLAIVVQCDDADSSLYGVGSA